MYIYIYIDIILKCLENYLEKCLEIYLEIICDAYELAELIQESPGHSQFFWIGIGEARKIMESTGNVSPSSILFQHGIHPLMYPSSISLATVDSVQVLLVNFKLIRLQSVQLCPTAPLLSFTT